MMVTREFLRPFSLQFPFDGTCNRIVSELEKRHWRVPGVSVEFHDYGTGERKFRRLSHVEGEGVRIKFGRLQRLLPHGRLNDSSATSEISIPGRLIQVYQEESGPTFYLYVGDDWERDRRRFVHGSKVNSKLCGEPRTYLRYGPGCDCDRAVQRGISFAEAQDLRHMHTNVRAPLLICHNDLGRDYDPEGDDPIVLRTSDVMAEFDAYVAGSLLSKILSHPIESIGASCEPPRSPPSPPSPPPPSDLGAIFCLGDAEDVDRIRRGKIDANELHPADRYGMQPAGMRLVSYGDRGDETIPRVAFDAFLPCGFVRDARDARSAEVFGDDPPGRNAFTILVKPKTADGIYVADHAAYERRRYEIATTATRRPSSFTPREIGECMASRGRTIVPLADYQGGFEKPIVLVGRELDLDEVEVLGGRSKRDPERP